MTPVTLPALAPLTIRLTVVVAARDIRTRPKVAELTGLVRYPADQEPESVAPVVISISKLPPPEFTARASQSQSPAPKLKEPTVTMAFAPTATEVGATVLNSPTKPAITLSLVVVPLILTAPVSRLI